MANAFRRILSAQWINKFNSVVSSFPYLAHPCTYILIRKSHLTQRNAANVPFVGLLGWHGLECVRVQSCVSTLTLFASILCHFILVELLLCSIKWFILTYLPHYVACEKRRTTFILLAASSVPFLFPASFFTSNLETILLFCLRCFRGLFT